MKVREVLRELTSDGREEVRPRTAGDHGQFTHPSRPGDVTIAGAPGDDLAPGTLGRTLPITKESHFRAIFESGRNDAVAAVGMEALGQRRGRMAAWRPFGPGTIY